MRQHHFQATTPHKPPFHLSDPQHSTMSTQDEIENEEFESEDAEPKRFSSICPIEQTLQYEPIPFHRVLTVQEVRNFYDTGMMPTDLPEDEADREPAYDESTWTEGGGVVSVR
jgi:hypothetical protein